jgi:hypothetical protein
MDKAPLGLEELGCSIPFLSEEDGGNIDCSMSDWMTPPMSSNWPPRIENDPLEKRKSRVEIAPRTSVSKKRPLQKLTSTFQKPSFGFFTLENIERDSHCRPSKSGPRKIEAPNPKASVCISNNESKAEGIQDITLHRTRRLRPDASSSQSDTLRAKYLRLQQERKKLISRHIKRVPRKDHDPVCKIIPALATGLALKRKKRKGVVSDRRPNASTCTVKNLSIGTTQINHSVHQHSAIAIQLMVRRWLLSGQASKLLTEKKAALKIERFFICVRDQALECQKRSARVNIILCEIQRRQIDKRMFPSRALYTIDEDFGECKVDY